MSSPALRVPQLRLRDLLAVPFALIRVPLYAVDRQVNQRLDPTSRVRILFDCSLGTVDILAGHVLTENGIAHNGVGRVQTALRRPPSRPAGCSAEQTRQHVADRSDTFDRFTTR